MYIILKLANVLHYFLVDNLADIETITSDTKLVLHDAF